MEDMETCKVCSENYHEKCRPRVLPCGHTYCTNCLEQLTDKGNLKCPRCQRNYKVTSAKDFSINYDLEEILSEAKKKLADTIPRDKTKTKRSTKMDTMISEQKVSTNNLILSMDEIESQLDQYHEFLLEKKKKHEEVLQKIQEIAKHHEVIVEGINEECVKIIEKKKERNEYRKEAKDKLTSVDNAKDNRDAGAVLVDLVDIMSHVEEWVERCQRTFPDVKVVSSEEFLTLSMEGLLMASSVRVEDVPEFVDLPEDDVTIMEKVALLIDNPKLTADELRLNSDHWKKQISFGRVNAVHLRDGCRRVARLSQKSDRIYLHCLEDIDSMPKGITAKHSDLLSFLDLDSVLAFMDLAWNDGSCQGRIHVLLSPDTPLARQFRILCTGDMGPSYAHTKFFSIHCKSTINEYIRGGDYENNNGTGGAPILEGINPSDKIYRRNLKTGAVFATRDKTTSAQFCIVIGAGNNYSTNIGVFGEIAEGIEVVKAAVRLNDIREVEIIDCGVVLPL